MYIYIYIRTICVCVYIYIYIYIITLSVGTRMQASPQHEQCCTQQTQSHTKGAAACTSARADVCSAVRVTWSLKMPHKNAGTNAPHTASFHTTSLQTKIC